MRRAILAALVVLGAGPAAAGEPTPLFAADAPISITIAAPWREVVRLSPGDEPVSATLTIGDETLPVLVGVRGKSRRLKNVCEFPPLRVEFAEKPTDASLFHGQKKLKLVTWCRKAEKHQEIVLKEYAAYRLYNVATDDSFRARLAAVSYVDTKSGETNIVRTGFFLEDLDDLARRVDRADIERDAVALASYDAGDAARAAVFNYMIGNVDWSMTEAPPGDECCHNIKVIGAEKTAEAGLTPIPYDFDMSGLVDAPYAEPPAQFRIKSVTTRVYRGFCSHNDETRAAAADFRNRREAFDAALAATPGLGESSLEKARAYLDSFFRATATDEAVEKNLLRRCRG